MPFITIKAVAGRTVEQKRALAKDITDAVVKNYGAPADAVSIDFVDYNTENLAKAGQLFSDR